MFSKSFDIRFIMTLIVVCISLFLLFFNLGEYALWDDEANTALFGQTVWQKGDTYALVDHNLIAHTYGKELEGLFNRYIPPLGYYLAAPFVGLNPGSSFWARFPFALCGFFTILLILYWLYKGKASVVRWCLMAAGILGSVSFMLFSRQCRYYAPSMLFSLIIVFVYFYRDQRKRTYMLLSVLLFLLLSTHFLSCFALLACLLVDYVVFGRKGEKISLINVLIVFTPLIVFGGILLNKYNLSYTSNVLNYSFLNWIRDKVNIVFWYLRGINSCEFGAGLLILVAPFMYYRNGNSNLLRCPLAIVVYILAMSIISPKPEYYGPAKWFYSYGVTNMRYVVPLIPLGIFTTVISIESLSRMKKPLIVLFAVLAFGTNILQKVILFKAINYSKWTKSDVLVPLRSTVFDYVGELMSPNKSAYKITASWVIDNVKDKETVWVVPEFAGYPLIYHAPKALYAWQLKEDLKSIEEMEDIHYYGKEAPQYIIAFGPYLSSAKDAMNELYLKGIEYEVAEQLNVYWYDLIRPELFWHSFKPINEFSLNDEAVYIYKRVKEKRNG